MIGGEALEEMGDRSVETRDLRGAAGEAPEERSVSGFGGETEIGFGPTH